MHRKVYRLCTFSHVSAISPEQMAVAKAAMQLTDNVITREDAAKLEDAPKEVQIAASRLASAGGAETQLPQIVR